MPNRELFNKPKSPETESIIKTNTDLATGQFATIAGIKGKQFGKEIFSAVLQFKDLKKFLNIFPEVQRGVSPRKVNQIKTYILSGIESNARMRFFSAMTVTVRSNAFYDEMNKQLAIDTKASKLSVNDGQHRFYGISASIEELEKKQSKAKTKELYDLYTGYLDELNEMIIPVVIFTGISEEEEKQLFYDINNKAQRPSRNAIIKLVQNDILSKMARELAETNKYLIKYGVEFNKNSIHKNNPNFILLTTVYAFIKNLYQQEIKQDAHFINEENYREVFDRVNTIFDKVFEALPEDLHIKGKYILQKNYAFKGISQFLYEVLQDNENDENAFAAISRVKWQTDINYWVRYDATLSNSGIITFYSNGEGGIKAVKKACLDEYRRIK